MEKMVGCCTKISVQQPAFCNVVLMALFSQSTRNRIDFLYVVRYNKGNLCKKENTIERKGISNVRQFGK